MSEDKNGEWISVEDRLPREVVDLVLVCRVGEVEATLPARYLDGEFLVSDGFHTVADRHDFKNPTHWMLLPEPPTNER